ncbi:MAG: DNA polymerase IV [Actinobacteria bacterium]|nr:DNA polymerase IV [Actinomycetota bacterium]
MRSQPGGTGGRGVVAAASYEARAYGVHSAMPSARARRLCPHAVFLPGRHQLYADYSRRLHVIFRTVTPLVEGIALDEAFLDVSGARRLLGDGPTIAAALRRKIRDELGLWASVGVAPNKLLAKLASEAAKPRTPDPGSVSQEVGDAGLGVKVVERGGELAFLHPHPVSALWGVGPATRRRLDRFGVQTVGDLAALPLETLVGALGQALGRHLHELAWGRDERPVVPERAPRSIGHEETYASDHHDRETLQREVVRLSDAVAARLRAGEWAGRTITLKVRFGDFRTITRSRTVADPVATGHDVAAVANALLAGIDASPGVRLLGVSASNLVVRPTRERSEQPTLTVSEWEDLESAVDEVRRRFGDGAVGPATLLDEARGLRLRRPGDQQWGPSVPSDEGSQLGS